MHHTQARDHERFLSRAAVTTYGALLATVILAIAPARAEAQTRPDKLELSYLWDGGVVPFVYGTYLARYALEQAAEPPDQPRFFSADEGGEPSMKSRELPGMVVTAGSAIFGATIALDDNPSRWFHLKGFAQGMATTAFLTGIGKNMVGRRRPDYDPTSIEEDGRRSFPSGHSSQALAAATYFGLYMYQHGFDRWREPGTMPWWEGATYVGIAALAIAVPVERVLHNRHHATDALAGSVLGAATSAAFFVYQERRYRKAKAAQYEVEPSGPMIAPTFDRPGVEILWQF
jgi:membrane-associated phospholipid phosphatase